MVVPVAAGAVGLGTGAARLRWVGGARSASVTAAAAAAAAAGGVGFVSRLEIIVVGMDADCAAGVGIPEEAAATAEFSQLDNPRHGRRINREEWKERKRMELKRKREMDLYGMGRESERQTKKGIWMVALWARRGCGERDEEEVTCQRVMDHGS